MKTGRTLHVNLVMMKVINDSGRISRLHSITQRVRENLEKFNKKIVDGLEAFERAKSMDINRPPNPNFKEIENKLLNLESYLKEIQNAYEMLKKDYKDIENKILKEKFTESMNISNYDDKDINHQEILLPKIREAEKVMNDVAKYLSNLKEEKNKETQEYFQKVIHLQTDLAKIEKYRPRYEKQFTKLNQYYFSYLFSIHNLVGSYNLTLLEISRRQTYLKEFTKFVKNIQENLQCMYDKENAQRRRFNMMYGKFLPENLIPGLLEEAPTFNVSNGSYSSQLPHVDITKINFVSNDFEKTFQVKHQKFAATQNQDPGIVHQGFFFLFFFSIFFFLFFFLSFFLFYFLLSFFFLFSTK